MKSAQLKTRISGIFHGVVNLQSIADQAAQLWQLHDVFSSPNAEGKSLPVSLRHEFVNNSEQQLVQQTQDKLLALSESEDGPLALYLLSLSDDCHWFSLCAPVERADLSTLQQVLHQLLSLIEPELDADNIVNFSEVANWLQNIAEDPDKPALSTLIEPEKLDNYLKQRLNTGRYNQAEKCSRVCQWPLGHLKNTIMATAERHQVSLTALIGAAIRTVLQAYNSKAELAYVCSFRSDESLQAVLGPLTSVLPLPAQVGPTFADTLKSEHRALHDMTELAECFYQTTASSYCHVYESFEYHSFAQIQLESVVHPVTDSSLAFMLLAQGADLQLSVTYQQSEFDEHLLGLLYTKIQTLLEHGQLDRQPWLAAAPVQQYPFASLAAWAHANLQQKPDTLLTEAYGAKCTLAELEQRAARLANYLREQGVGSGCHVVIYFSRSIDFFVAILAVSMTGATYVPLDDGLPLRRVQQIATQLKPACILTKGATLALLEQVHVIDLDKLCLLRYPTHIELPTVKLTDVAYIIFTSGSTGEPKGIEVSQEALLNHMTWFINHFKWSSQDVLLQKTNAGFDASIWEFWLVLLTGVDCVIATGNSSYDLALFIKILHDYRITSLQLVPSYLALLLDHPDFGPTLALNKLFCGGEALKTSIARQVTELIPTQLVNLYGPSECCIDATSFEYRSDLCSDFVPIGYPIGNLKAVVQQETGQFAEVGQTGELLIAGPAVFNGYFQDADKTRAATYIDADGERFYRTGDLVQILSDDQLYFMGRIDNQIKLNGFRVDLNAIGCTAEALAGVLRAECFFQEESRQLVLFCKTTAPVTEVTIRQHLAAELPAYMVPERCLLIDEFPLTRHGKVDAKKLLCHCAVRPSDYVAPANELEASIAQIWQDVFKKTEPVSVTDNFFSLGGDSILGIKVVYQLNKAGIDVPLLTLMKHPTIRAMAQMVEQTPSAVAASSGTWTDYQRPPELAGLYQDLYPATGMQRFMLRQYEQDHQRLGLFHPQSVIWLQKSDISYAQLQQLLALEMQHVNFRTRFVETSDGLFQVLLKTGRVECHQLQADNASEFQQLIRHTLVADNQRRFHWRDPNVALIRFYYIEGPTDDVAILMSNLHTIQDGWGNVEFQNHLLARYRQTDHTTAAEIAALPNVCKEFALQELLLQQNPEIAAFWRQQSTHFSNSCWQYQSFGADRIDSMVEPLPATLLDNARRWAKLHGVQLKTVLLSSLSKAISHVFGDHKTSLGLVTNGRNSALSDPLHAMGLFWNLMPLKLPSKQEVTALVQTAHQQLIELEPYSRYPFDQQIEIYQGLMPIWSTFNYIDFHHRDDEPTSEVSSEHDRRVETVLPAFLGQDYFGFPLESSFSIQNGQCVWLLQVNPAAITAIELRTLVAEFQLQLGFFIP